MKINKVPGATVAEVSENFARVADALAAPSRGRGRPVKPEAEKKRPFNRKLSPGTIKAIEGLAAEREESEVAILEKAVALFASAAEVLDDLAGLAAELAEQEPDAADELHRAIARLKGGKA